MSAFLEALRRAACPHENRTEPDELGDAICADCGGVARVVLTEAALRRAFEQAWRRL